MKERDQLISTSFDTISFPLRYPYFSRPLCIKSLRKLTWQEILERYLMENSMVVHELMPFRVLLESALSFHYMSELNRKTSKHKSVVWNTKFVSRFEIDFIRYVQFLQPFWEIVLMSKIIKVLD